MNLKTPRLTYYMNLKTPRLTYYMNLKTPRLTESKDSQINILHESTWGTWVKSAVTN